MSFQVSHQTWLDTEAARIGELILAPKYWGRTWTDASLHHELQDLGLYYTRDQVKELNDQLHKLSVVEDVVIAQPSPLPVEGTAEPA